MQWIKKRRRRRRRREGGGEEGGGIGRGRGRGGGGGGSGPLSHIVLKGNHALLTSHVIRNLIIQMHVVGTVEGVLLPLISTRPRPFYTLPTTTYPPPSSIKPIYIHILPKFVTSIHAVTCQQLLPLTIIVLYVTITITITSIITIIIMLFTMHIGRLGLSDITATHPSRPLSPFLSPSLSSFIQLSVYLPVYHII